MIGCRKITTDSAVSRGRIHSARTGNFGCVTYSVRSDLAWSIRGRTEDYAHRTGSMHLDESVHDRSVVPVLCRARQKGRDHFGDRLILNAVLNYPLIQVLGLTGSVTATAIASGVILAVLFMQLRASGVKLGWRTTLACLSPCVLVLSLLRG